MAISGSLQFSHDLGFCKNQPSNNNHNQFFKVLFPFLSFPFFLPFVVVVVVVVSSSSFFFQSILLGKGKVPLLSNTSLKVIIS